MLKSDLLRLLQQEIRRHDFSYFVENPPSAAQCGNGVVVPGCPACKVRINTMPQFLDHLANDVLPKPNRVTTGQLCIFEWRTDDPRLRVYRVDSAVDR